MEDTREVVKLMMKEAVTEEFRKAIDPTSVKMWLLEQTQIWNKVHLLYNNLYNGKGY
jgi:hypothetical protein